MHGTTAFDRWFRGPQSDAAPPPEAVLDDGRLQCGTFAAPLDMTALPSATLLGGLRRDRPGLPRLIEWIGCGMAHPDVYVAVIVAQARLLSMLQLYVTDRHSGRTFRHARLAPPQAARVAPRPWSSRTRMATAGARISIEHRLDAGRHDVSIDLPARPGCPAVRGDLTWHEDLAASPPLVALAPMGGRRFVYNHKALLRLSGTLRLGDRIVAYDPTRDVANLDEVRARLGPRNHYRWATFGVAMPTGLVGLNATDSRERHRDWGRENVIWAGTRLTPLGDVRIEGNPRATTRPWRIRDDVGRVDVVFAPEGGMTISAGPLGRYLQRCGTFHGRLHDGTGTVHRIDGAVGCLEDVAVL